MTSAPVLDALPISPQQLGESPVWHAQEQALYWVDIAARGLHRWDWHSATHRHWQLDDDPGCVAPVQGGGVVLALRQGIVHFDTDTGRQWLLARAPYDTATQRFNDGKVDPWGRFWVGTIHEPRDQPLAHLYRLGPEGLHTVWGQCTVSNGLAWSPAGDLQYWSDTWGHRLYRSPVDASGAPAAQPQAWKHFARKAGIALDLGYAGRPDGGAVDAQGHYWSAMFEGGRLVRFSPGDTEPDLHLALPVRCPTMPCFAGPNLDTLVVTTSRYQRHDTELHATPWAGRVLVLPAPCPGTCPPLIDPQTLPTP